MFKILPLLLFILSLILPVSSFAHETESDNGIGAILHVDPGDAPIAGQESTLFFEFTDMENKLNLNNCICSIVITKGNQEVLREEFSGMPGTTGVSGVVPFVFPESDIYKAIVTGNPKEPGQFRPFELNFTIRVEKNYLGTLNEVHEREHNTWVDHAKHYSIAVVTIIFLLAALYFTSKKKKLAVILLALVLISHLLPIKAIHAAHSGTFDSEAYECCIPQAATLASAPLIIQEARVFQIESFKDKKQIFAETNIDLFSRPPPL